MPPKLEINPTICVDLCPYHKRGCDILEAVPFGSDDKPFEICERYVVTSGDFRGRIITTRLDGQNYLSAASIYPKKN